MVSTRGVKLKFFDGERVLCYEPDPTKAKVLYDSKVLQVIVNKDQRGRKNVEYLIHFQGWNSSWDRCVSEDFVLKDTPENRQLQKDLADKAQLQLGAYLYRRERSKKRKERKLSERIAPSSEDGSSGSPAQMDTDDGNAGVTTSSDSNSSGDEDVIPIDLTSTLRHALEHDFYLINTKNKLLKLPAEPHVASILEKYWKYYSHRELNKMSDKPNTRHRQSMYGSNLLKQKPEYIQKHINTCKEIVDGLRVCFDYTLSDLLLYNAERDQVVIAQATDLSVCPNIKIEMSSPELIKTEPDDIEYAHLPSFDPNRLSIDEKAEPLDMISSRRRLRSHRSVDSDCNGSQQDVYPIIKTENSIASNSDVSTNLNKLLTWNLLPEHVYNQDPPPPCLVYGATHLTRLLVKLPDILYANNMADDKLKTLLMHLDSFVEFLSEHKEWYGDKHYMDSDIQE